MYIGSVNNSTVQNSKVSGKSNTEKQVASLEKQKMNIDEQIDSIKNSSTDERTKREQIAELEAQKTTIESQIASLRKEESEEKTDGSKEKGKTRENKDTYVKNNESKEDIQLKNVQNILTSISSISKLSSMKKHASSEINTLKYEMSTQKNGPTHYEISRMAELNEKITKLDSEITKKTRKINKTLKNGAEKLKHADKKEKIEKSAEKKKTDKLKNEAKEVEKAE